jgi:hypothetical protein
MLLCVAAQSPAPGAGGAPNDANPYAYDISAFRKVPPEWLRYQEETNFLVSIVAPAALAVDASNRVYVAGANAVAVFDRPDKLSLSFGLERPARCMAVSASGDVLIGTADHIDVYSPTGGLRASWVSLGERALVTSVAARGEHVYVADCGNPGVWHFDTSGRLKGSIGIMDDAKHFIIPSPSFAVAVAPDESVWIANPGKCLVEHYSRDLRFIGQFGEPSMKIEGFCGCCNPTHLAVLPDGRLVTSEKGIPRIKVYTAAGALSAVVAGPDLFAPGGTGPDVAADAAGRVLALDPALATVRIFSERSKPVAKP